MTKTDALIEQMREQAEVDREDGNHQAAAATEHWADKWSAALAGEREMAGAIGAWWQEKRPCAWTEDEHRANPTINCGGQAEQRLARVAASLPLSTRGR